MVTIKAFDPGETAAQITAIKITKDDILYIRPPESVLPLIAIIPDHFQLFKMSFGTAEIITCPGGSGLINIIGTRGGFHTNGKNQFPCQS
jgi:hypothetical protein